MSWNLSLRYVVLWIVLGFFFLNFHLIPFPLLIFTQDNQPSLLHTTTTESLYFLQIRKIAQSNEIGAARLFVILTGRFSHFITYFFQFTPGIYGAMNRQSTSGENHIKMCYKTNGFACNLKNFTSQGLGDWWRFVFFSFLLTKYGKIFLRWT